ncbi:hypothetical protein N7532_011448 [Penicillium argentinense]|uniref:Uncharacterized protein n=1 Tax=Penicillium argentinense TaxID=1131581 RepID=A0A9W9EIM9_9EURO|nr:uncharacterized protein N7532_011448 [Penicillium argentinense]KAJ5082405.1 hypothetical protein N7532_011448 [Penicillium argentinense]
MSSRSTENKDDDQRGSMVQSRLGAACKINSMMVVWGSLDSKKGRVDPGIVTRLQPSHSLSPVLGAICRVGFPQGFQSCPTLSVVPARRCRGGKGPVRRTGDQLRGIPGVFDRQPGNPRPRPDGPWGNRKPIVASGLELIRAIGKAGTARSQDRLDFVAPKDFRMGNPIWGNTEFRRISPASFVRENREHAEPWMICAPRQSTSASAVTGLDGKVRSWGTSPTALLQGPLAFRCCLVRPISLPSCASELTHVVTLVQVDTIDTSRKMLSNKINALLAAIWMADGERCFLGCPARGIGTNW